MSTNAPTPVEDKNAADVDPVVCAGGFAMTLCVMTSSILTRVLCNCSSNTYTIWVPVGDGGADSTLGPAGPSGTGACVAAGASAPALPPMPAASCSRLAKSLAAALPAPVVDPGGATAVTEPLAAAPGSRADFYIFAMHISLGRSMPVELTIHGSISATSAVAAPYAIDPHQGAAPQCRGNGSWPCGARPFASRKSGARR